MLGTLKNDKLEFLLGAKQPHIFLYSLQQCSFLGKRPLHRGSNSHYSQLPLANHWKTRLDHPAIFISSWCATNGRLVVSNACQLVPMSGAYGRSCSRQFHFSLAFFHISYMTFGMQGDVLDLVLLAMGTCQPLQGITVQT